MWKFETERRDNKMKYDATKQTDEFFYCGARKYNEMISDLNKYEKALRRTYQALGGNYDLDIDSICSVIAGNAVIARGKGKG